MRRRKTIEERVIILSETDFRHMLCRERVIRPASLDDVYGTYHQRSLYRHPRTDQFYIRSEK